MARANREVEPKVDQEVEPKVEPKVEPTTITTEKEKTSRDLKVSSNTITADKAMVIGSIRTAPRPTTIRTGVAVEVPTNGLVLVSIAEELIKNSRLRVIYPQYLIESTDDLEIIVENVGIDAITIRKDQPLVTCVTFEAV